MAKRRGTTFFFSCLIALAAAAGCARGQTAAPSKTDLEIKKLNVEIEKLQAETTELRSVSNGAIHWLEALGLGSVLGGALVFFAGFGLNRLQRRKLEQDMEISRSDQQLRLFEALGAESPKVRIGAVSELGQRVRNLTDAPDAAAKRQIDTIIRVLIAVTKHEDNPDIQKHIGDLLFDLLDAGRPGQSASPLSRFDFQGARFTNVWWKGVDARGADFYRAVLTRAGLADAMLERAMFKNAELSGATLRRADASAASLEAANLTGVKAEGIQLQKAILRNADLSGADLRNANLRDTDLRGARLNGANFVGAVVDGALCQGVDFTAARCDGLDFSKIVRDQATRV